MGACKEWRPVATMLAVDVVFAVTNTMIKKAIDEGLNRLVFITLRQLVATLFMAPVAYFHERYREHTLSLSRTFLLDTWNRLLLITGRRGRS